MLSFNYARRRLFLRTQYLRFKSEKAAPVPFVYQELFDLADDTTTKYRKLTSDYVSTVTTTIKEGGVSKSVEFLKVEPEALRLLSAQAMTDIAHLLRPAHLTQLSNILKDDEATSNDKFVALELLKNANIASNFVLPGCQDTGTAIISGKRGQFVLTDGNDEEHLSKGVYDTYTKTNLRYSQVAPLDMFKEVNTKTNLPAQIDLYATSGAQYDFQFIAKGMSITYLYQQTKALLNPNSLMKFLEDNIKTIGTSACPPYHLAIVIGGLSAELTLKTVKLASTKYYDNLPTSGNEHGRAFRDLETEAQVLKMTQKMGIGAQFGGKYFCHDVRVIRLPRHGASCPVGLGVSCSADRQVKAKITSEGVFIEQLETDVGKYLPDVTDDHLKKSTGSPEIKAVEININKPMADLRAELSNYPIVARDIAHAKILERLESGGGLPDYVKQYMIYYAGPAKTPEGYASGSFGPTTAGRMDSYVGKFMAEGGSFITLACKTYKGFYLGSIGGPAAILAKNCIKKVEVLEYPELGMEAVWKIDVENFPAFIVVDDKGNDFYSKWIP
eukprot:gene29136-38199_t